SLSASSCPGFDVFGQLSIGSQNVSLSVSGCTASTGQAALEPVHCSAMSQAPAAERQTVLAGWKLLDGQTELEPVQFSATSQTPAELRQTVADDAKPSPGQLAPEPVQFSATSHTLTALRHTVELGREAFAGQLSVEPSQASAWSHTPAAARHGVPDPAFTSAGQAVFEPSQFSATSHTPAWARQSVPGLPAGCVQVFPTPSQMSSVQTFESAVHGVLSGCLSSVGQFTPAPSQFSVASHSSTAERQTTKAPETLSAGHG